MEESFTRGGKPGSLESAGGRHFRKLNTKRVYGHSLQAEAGLGTGRSLCWWMAVQQGRAQTTGQAQKIIAES